MYLNCDWNAFIIGSSRSLGRSFAVRLLIVKQSRMRLGPPTIKNWIELRGEHFWPHVTVKKQRAHAWHTTNDDTLNFENTANISLCKTNDSVEYHTLQHTTIKRRKKNETKQRKKSGQKFHFNTQTRRHHLCFWFIQNIYHLNHRPRQMNPRPSERAHDVDMIFCWALALHSFSVCIFGFVLTLSCACFVFCVRCYGHMHDLFIFNEQNNVYPILCALFHTYFPLSKTDLDEHVSRLVRFHLFETTRNKL